VLDEMAAVEKVEAELDAFITRRALKMNPEQQRVEDGWAESTRKHNERLRQERLWDRLDYHRRQLEAHTRTFERLIKRHKSGLRLVEEALGLPISEETRGDAA
jgi:hypothetical protein